ncbi:hypothetical protein CsSME_00022055 [Camellia sinensis var. sinensis]
MLACLDASLSVKLFELRVEKNNLLTELKTFCFSKDVLVVFGPATTTRHVYDVAAQQVVNAPII